MASSSSGSGDVAEEWRSTPGMVPKLSRNCSDAALEAGLGLHSGCLLGSGSPGKKRGNVSFSREISDIGDVLPVLGSRGSVDVDSQPRRSRRSLSSGLLRRMLTSSQPLEENAEAETEPRSVSRRRGTFGAATLLERLLPEGEQVTECMSEELETAGGLEGAMTSYKRFTKAPMGGSVPQAQRNPLVVRRAGLWSALQGFRLLDRNAPFGQSRGQWAVTKVNAKKGEVHILDDQVDAKTEFRKLLMRDIYHLFLDCSLTVQLLWFLIVYLFSFSFFALLFMVSEEPCGLKLKYSFVRAYMLSIETMLTIGYGVSDPYMQGCWQGPLILTSQSLLNLLLSACLIGIIFQKFSQPQSRASMIVFSDKAVIRCIEGVHYLMFRICDLRFHSALVEPHIRLYCCHMSHDNGAKFAMTPMRLQHPDDELGASLAPGLPNLIVHRIDAWSPLAPRSSIEQRSVQGRLSQISEISSARISKASYSSDSSLGCPNGLRTRREKDHMRQYVWPSTQQRQVNCETGNRSGSFCPTCGESFATPSLLKLHCKYLAHTDKASGVPAEISHYELGEEDVLQTSPFEPSRTDIQEHLAQGYFEVVVLVEGVEPTTAATLQARHSYHVQTAGGDVEWDRDFVECVRMKRAESCAANDSAAGRSPFAESSRGLVVDIGCFHLTEEIDPEQGGLHPGGTAGGSGGSSLRR